MNPARETYNQIAYAHEKGGQEKAYEIARNLLAMKLDIDSISKATGLTKDEILTLEKTS